MTYENLIYEKEDGIAKITINRPKVMNALTPALLLELKAALQKAADDKDVGVVVLTGVGRAFSAGVDLTALKDPKLDRRQLTAIAKDVINTMQFIPKVVIAMVNGYCLTGGLEIALSCDLIIASEEAKFGDTHVRWGLRPRWGMSQLLPRAIGVLKAKELSFTADMLTGKEAERIGLVNMAVPAERLEETVKELAKKIMSNRHDSVAAYKYLYNQGMRGTMEEGLQLELEGDFVIDDAGEKLEKFGGKG